MLLVSFWLALSLSVYIKTITLFAGHCLCLVVCKASLFRVVPCHHWHCKFLRAFSFASTQVPLISHSAFSAKVLLFQKAVMFIDLTCNIMRDVCSIFKQIPSPESSMQKHGLILGAYINSTSKWYMVKHAIYLCHYYLNFPSKFAALACAYIIQYWMCSLCHKYATTTT